MTWYNWLVDNGLWRDVISFSVGAILGLVVATHPFRLVHRALFRISDQLDTRTPGGLTDILRALKETETGPEIGGSEMPSSPVHGGTKHTVPPRKQ